MFPALSTEQQRRVAAGVVASTAGLRGVRSPKRAA
jgi:hypothetical protein